MNVHVPCVLLYVQLLLQLNYYYSLISFLLAVQSMTDCLRQMKLRQSGVRDARRPRDSNVSGCQFVDVLLIVTSSVSPASAVTLRKTTWRSRTRYMDKDVIFSRCSNSCHQLLNSSMNSLLFTTFCGLALFRWLVEEVDNFESSTRVSSTLIISSVLGQGRSASLLDVYFCHSSSSFSQSEVPEFYPSPELRRSSRCRSQPCDASLLIYNWKVQFYATFLVVFCVATVDCDYFVDFLIFFLPQTNVCVLCSLSTLYTTII